MSDSWDPMDCSPPGSSAHGIFQARRLDWVAISFSRGSSQPRDQTRVSSIADSFLTNWATGEETDRVYTFQQKNSSSLNLTKQFPDLKLRQLK